MRILIAPDKFKDALDAAAVANAIRAGVLRARPDAQVDCCPLADGGEGTGRLLGAALAAREHTLTIHDPLGRTRAGRWWHVADQLLGIVEMAEASGLALLRADERDALQTTTYGTGELLHAAMDAACRRVLLCVGGSATVDGGAGCLQALGWRFHDEQGLMDAPPTGGRLRDVQRLEPPAAAPRIDIEILCDVDNPLLGPRGAAAVFAPQKGATPDGVARLDRALTHWAELLRQTHARDVATKPGAGAAGGLPAGLVAALGARIVPGFDRVAAHVGLRQRLEHCDLCITGEGSLDEQTSGGKVVAGAARVAADAGVPVVVLAGAVRTLAGQTLDDLARVMGVERIVAITPDGLSLDEALAATADNLRRAAEQAVRKRAP